MMGRLSRIKGRSWRIILLILKYFANCWIVVRILGMDFDAPRPQPSAPHRPGRGGAKAGMATESSRPYLVSHERDDWGSPPDTRTTTWLYHIPSREP